MWLAFKYAVFAGIATVVNIVSQDITMRIYTGLFAIYVSIAVGTLTGLVTKYLLDKRYICSSSLFPHSSAVGAISHLSVLTQP